MESYRNGVLHVDHVSLASLADRYQTPFYVYSKRKIEENLRTVLEGLKYPQHIICYPVRSNYSLGIISIFKQLGTGFVVSNVEELRRVLKIGGDPKKVVLAGPGKTRAAISQAIANDVLCIHAESWQELERIEEIARASNKVVPVGIRVNPEVDARAHPHLATSMVESKYGFPLQEAEDACVRVHLSRFMELVGVKYHLGSQVLVFEPFVEASDKIVGLVDSLKGKGIVLKHVDIGGGIGVPLRVNDDVPGPVAWIRHLTEPVEKRELRVICEPGRLLISNAAVLVTRVEYVKKTASKNYLIVDAGLSDLVTPVLCESYHDIRNVRDGPTKRTELYDIVGPGSGPAETFGLGRYLPATEQGDVLAILTVGAYGFCMSSNFASRNHAMEIVVDGPTYAIIRERQTLEQQVVNERFFK
ncbi:diaminopimelate decarboxylase-like [Amblyomma americanum]|uniref:Diaminopimelate decarboxylase n=1 Tax=Amblyomma americanum TaxID=6943 RepID=A0AAQ4EN96_AMBAM